MNQHADEGNQLSLFSDTAIEHVTLCNPHPVHERAGVPLFFPHDCLSLCAYSHAVSASMCAGRFSPITEPFFPSPLPLPVPGPAANSTTSSPPSLPSSCLVPSCRSLCRCLCHSCRCCRNNQNKSHQCANRVLPISRAVVAGKRKAQKTQHYSLPA